MISNISKTIFNICKKDTAVELFCVWYLSMVFIKTQNRGNIE